MNVPVENSVSLCRIRNLPIPPDKVPGKNRNGIAPAENSVMVEPQSPGDQVQDVVYRAFGVPQSVPEFFGPNGFQSLEQGLPCNNGRDVPKQPVQVELVASAGPASKHLSHLPARF